MDALTSADTIGRGRVRGDEGRLFDGIRVALFDLDGTLIDTHIDFAAMKLEMLDLVAEQGLVSDRLRSLDILAIVEEGTELVRRTTGHAAARAFRAAAFDRLRQIEVEQCASPVELVGASELLAALRSNGVKVGIVTRNSREVAQKLTERGRLHRDVLVTRDDVRRTKPDPDHLREALRLLGAHGLPHDAVIMVGDHWMDILAGRRAGCRTVGLLRSRGPGWYDRAQPDVLFEDIAELARVYEDSVSTVSRRELLVLAGADALADGTIGFPAPPPKPVGSAEPKELARIELDGIAICCTHEHWGSLVSFGMTREGFRADVLRGALPQRTTGLFDVILDPYFSGWLAGSGVDLGAVARDAGVPSLHGASPDDVARCWRALRPHVSAFGMTGAYQTLRIGLRSLHGIDIAMDSVGAVVQLDRKVGEAYASLYAWYEMAMKKARLIRPIRPVHPEFFWKSDDAGDPSGEDRVFRPILRIDPLVDLWPRQCPRRDALAELTGVDPGDAASWRRFLTALMERAASRRCVGIKQLQAYTRDLDFGAVTDGDVVFRGELDERERRAFGNWVVHECCKLANDRGWPHQIHTGTHNLPHSNPLPLATLAQRYRRMQIVLLHCWPYLTEAGWLAWQHPNVHLDGCWMPVINPACLREALVRWLGLIPHTKVMCGQDATSVEMAVGSAHLLRDAVAGHLAEAVARGTLTERAAIEAAHDILHGNAERLYGG